MIAYTSSGTGFWDLAATWGGSGPPGPPDTVTIQANHVVTVRSNTGAGNNSASGTNGLVVAGQLVINTGVTFTVTSDILMTGTTGSNGQVNCAGNLVFDGTAGAGVKYKVAVGGQHSTTAKLIFSGTSGARASFSSAGTGATNAFCANGGWIAGGRIEADYCDFTRVGDAGNTLTSFWTSNSATSNVFFRNCTFAGCGRITGATNIDAAANFDVSDSTWSGTAASICLTTIMSATATGTRTLRNNRFDKEVDFTSGTLLAVTHNMFNAGYTFTGVMPATWQYNLANNGAFVSGLVGVPAETNCYRYDDTGSNAHTFILSPSLNYTPTGLVFDVPRGGTGDLVTSNNTAGNTASITNCLVIPTSAGINPGELVSPLGSGWTYTVEHNTVVCTALPASSPECGVCVYGETHPGNAGMYASIKSNLVYSPTGKGSALLRHVQGTASDTLASGSAGDYNAFNAPINATGSGVQAVYGAQGGYCDTVGTVTNPMFTTTPTGLGAHDLVCSPNFVDTTRNLATFDSAYLANAASAWATGAAYVAGDIRSAVDSGFYGGATVNFRCVLAHTSAAGNATNGQPGVAASWRTNWEFASLYRIRASNAAYTSATRQATPRDLWEWVRAGWTPQNAQLKNAGHDGADIGAVPVVTAPTLTAGAATFVGSGPTGITLSATSATLGTAPYTYRWQRMIHGGTTFIDLADVGGVTGSATLGLFDGSAAGGTLYDYRLKCTDAAASTAFSNAVPAAGAQVYLGGPIGGGGTAQSQTSDFDGGF